MTNRLLHQSDKRTECRAGGRCPGQSRGDGRLVHPCPSRIFLVHVPPRVTTPAGMVTLGIPPRGEHPSQNPWGGVCVSGRPFWHGVQSSPWRRSPATRFPSWGFSGALVWSPSGVSSGDGLRPSQPSCPPWTEPRRFVVSVKKQLDLLETSRNGPRHRAYLRGHLQKRPRNNLPLLASTCDRSTQGQRSHVAAGLAICRGQSPLSTRSGQKIEGFC